MHANVVIALGSEAILPDILTHIHGAGLGHNAYVLRPRRTSIQQQLTRSGIPTAQMPARVDEAEAALVVHAAARAGLAADLTRQHGAAATWIVTPNGTWNLIDDDLAAAQITHPTPGAQTAPAAMPQPDASASPDETPGI